MKFPLNKSNFHFPECMLIVGAFQGPLYHIFYKLLDTTIRGATIRKCLIKSMLNLFVFSPIAITFFITNSCIWCDYRHIEKCNAREKFGAIYLVIFFQCNVPYLRNNHLIDLN